MQAQRSCHTARFNETKLTVLHDRFPHAKE